MNNTDQSEKLGDCLNGQAFNTSFVTFPFDEKSPIPILQSSFLLIEFIITDI